MGFWSDSDLEAAKRQDKRGHHYFTEHGECMRRGRPDLADRAADKAVGCFQEATRLDPTNARYWADLGLGFYMRRSFESSIESYKKAVAIEPGWAAAWHWLGAVLDEIGRTEEAIGCFDRMLALNPDDEGAKWLKTDCQAKLGSSPSRV